VLAHEDGSGACDVESDFGTIGAQQARRHADEPGRAAGQIDAPVRGVQRRQPRVRRGPLRNGRTARATPRSQARPSRRRSDRRLRDELGRRGVRCRGGPGGRLRSRVRRRDRCHGHRRRRRDREPTRSPRAELPDPPR
jgi:hypothetical protein